MRRLLLLLLLPVIVLAPNDLAQGQSKKKKAADGGIQSGLWRVKMDSEIDGKINAPFNEDVWKISVKEGKIKGSRRDAVKGDVHRDHVYQGEVLDGVTRVIILRAKSRDSAPWVRVFLGQYREGRIVGTYYDNDKEVRGDFEITIGGK